MFTPTWLVLLGAVVLVVGGALALLILGIDALASAIWTVYDRSAFGQRRTDRKIRAELDSYRMTPEQERAARAVSAAHKDDLRHDHWVGFDVSLRVQARRWFKAHPHETALPDGFGEQVLRERFRR